MDAATLLQARTLHHAGESEAAERLCRAVLADAPESAPARQLLGDVLRQRGQPAAAVRALEQALAVDPAHLPALCSLAMERLRSGRAADTARACAAALAVDPGDPAALAALGTLRLAQGRAAEAERLYGDALRRRPEMPTVQAAFAQLLTLAHRPHDAARAARRALALKPGQGNVQALLGIARRNLGEPPDAIIHAFRRAFVLAPERAETCVHLSNTLVDAGRVGEAAYTCRLGLASDPANLPLWLELANSRQLRAEPGPALAAYRHAAALDPMVAAVYTGVAKLHREAGAPERAAESLKRAVALEPGNRQTLGECALTLALAGRHAEAGAAALRGLRLAPGSLGARQRLREVLQLNERHADALEVARAVAAEAPDRAAVHFELGVTLHRVGRLDEALRALNVACALDPAHLPSLIDAGQTLLDRGDFTAAEIVARRALRVSPRSAAACNNLGLALYKQQRFAEAKEALRGAVEREPAHGQWHNNLALVLLTHGELAEGFRELEWRWNNTAFHIHRRDFPHPALVEARPDGGSEALRLEDGKALLLWGEQGIGDEIIYAGLIPAVAALGTRCVLECAPRLVPLFERSMPGVRVVPRRTPPDPATRDPAIAFHCPTGSLGRWVLAESGFPPRSGGYLSPDPALTARLRARYREAGGQRVVGISWRSKGLLGGARKSVPLDAWEPILTLPGLTFVNLQYGDCRAELEEIRSRLGVEVVQDGEVDQLTDMDAFAAQVAAMDHVISTSNTTAHVAGALGVPVWTLLPPEPLLWYWFAGRTDSPWYPTMRLFRQAPSTGWGDLLAHVAEELKGGMTDGGGGPPRRSP